MGTSPSTADQAHQRPYRHLARLGPLWIGGLATVCVLATISPSAGPGITVDEFYDVAAGKRLVHAWQTHHLGFFRFDEIDRTFGPLTRHPPLGRWLLGWTHAMFDPRPENPDLVSVVAGRFAPAVAFGGLVVLLGWTTARVAGNASGAAAAAGVALVPRIFGHAHLATLDTFTALFYVVALVALGEALRRDGHAGWFALAGVAWGLAMLTKLHGLLLFVPCSVVMVWFLRRRVLGPWLVWAFCGAFTFFAGWPWLWPSPLARFREFLGTSTQRTSLHVFYLDRVWQDHAVPWHYPWIMLLVTIPVGLLVLGMIGVVVDRHRWATEPLHALLAAGALWMLVVFSLPGVPVYDGIRLFLMVPAIWAFPVGLGAGWMITEINRRRLGRGVCALVPIFILLQGIGIVAMHPFYLSHYSLLLGGLRGAERLGFEATYWGDAVNGRLLESAVTTAPRQDVLFAPHLAPFQAGAVEASSPELALAGTHLVGWNAAAAGSARGCRYALVYRRQADFSGLGFLLDSGVVVDENARQGVWLARLYRLPASAEELFRRSRLGSKNSNLHAR